MREITPELKDHLAQQTTTTLATCWRIKRNDGVELFFTDHDVPVVFEGNEYTPISTDAASAIKQTSDMSVDNFDISFALSSTLIKEDDIRNGLYDHAEMWIFLVNYSDLTQGALKLAYGHLGECELTDYGAKVEFRSLSQKLQQKIGRIYGYTCDAMLGDSRCKIALNDYKVVGAVSEVTDKSTFTDSAMSSYPDGWFAYGVLTWTSGANAGKIIEVKSFLDGTFTLVEPMFYDIAVNDTYEVTAGCDKQFSTCKAKFNNGINFRGFPHIPGQDEAMRYPDAH